MERGCDWKYGACVLGKPSLNRCCVRPVFVCPVHVFVCYNNEALSYVYDRDFLIGIGETVMGLSIGKNGRQKYFLYLCVGYLRNCAVCRTVVFIKEKDVTENRGGEAVFEYN